MTTYTTPAVFNLPSGKYRISMPRRVTEEKYGLPLVYTFKKWNDNLLTPTRDVLLQADLKLVAEFKTALKPSLTLWAKIVSVIIRYKIANLLKKVTLS